MTKISLYLVEDYFLSRVSYTHSFKKYEEVELLNSFENAEDCIEQMQKQQADIVLMDLGLQNMNGIEATKIIKEKYPSTKIIVLTSHQKAEEVLSSLANGANAYALKDIEFDKLVEVIKLVKFGAHWYDPQIEQIATGSFSKLTPKSCEEIKKKLTRRELEVLKLMVEGKSNSEIGDEILISSHTAKAHVGSILDKLGVQDRVQAAVKAVRANLF